MDVINIYGVVISTLGAVFIFTLKDISKAGNRMLFSFFATFITKYSLELLNENLNNLLLSNISSSISLAKYIFFFLYLKYMTSDLKRIKQKDILFFLPSSLLLIYMVAAKYDFVTGYVNPNIHFQIINRLFSVFMAVFLILSFNILKRHHKELKNYYSYESAKISLVWVVGILTYDVIIHLVGVGWNIFSSNMVVDIYIKISRFYMFNETITLLIIMVLGIWQSTISPTQIAKLVAKKEVNEKLGSYVPILKAYMEKNKPYIDGNLSIDSLAEQLNLKRQDLSEIINFHLKTNFFNFIKEYRVNHMIELMKNDNSDNIKLLYLAFDSGFNSKSAFNRAFKEVTGKTPSEYMTILKR